MNNICFIPSLLEWYFFHKREFPWRTQIYTDRHLWVYHTWICEVMSQQTLLSVVLPKFKKFITELPDVEALANCSDELLRYLWSGLGYYARARNLRNGANFILSSYNGHFPSTKKEWLNVPGCGEYTSSIIASICFSEPVPAVDGNVIRVASRLLGLKEHVWEKLGQQKILNFMTSIFGTHATKHKPGDINQAFMDFGSLVCKKSSPLCKECPIQNSCVAYKKNIVDLCPPVKPRKQTQSENVFALVLYHKKNDKYLLVNRENGFLSKTMGFPLYAAKNGFSLNSIVKAAQTICPQVIVLKKTFNHQITHHKIKGFVTLLEDSWDEIHISKLEQNFTLPVKKHWVSKIELKKHLSSSLDQKVLQLLLF